MSRVDLPSGGWVELRDPDDITERQRRTVSLLMSELSPQAKQSLAGAADEAAAVAIVGETSRDDAEILFRMNDALAMVMIAGWSFDFPPLAETLPDIPGRDYKAVLEAVAPFIGAVLGLDTSPSPEPASPT